MSNLRDFFPVSLNPFRKKKKILLIHSDDWGSLRMPSIQIQRALDKHPLIEANDAYALNDTLESKEDIEALCNVLSIFTDENGKSPQITANNVMGNPDFQRIRESDLEAYYLEDLQTTFSTYQQESALKAWRQAEDEKLFHFQFHGREHVNVHSWLRLLREGHEGVLKAFDHGVFGVRFKNLGLRKSNFQAAWDYQLPSELDSVLDSIEEGMTLFENFFNRKSHTAIAPSYTWSNRMEVLLKRKGVKAMQTGLVQKIPNGKASKYQRKYRLLYTPSYQVRNAYFEPTLMPNKDVVDHCLKEIEKAFHRNRPAIISSHRINFIGGLNAKNRDVTLTMLNQLLGRVLKKWPDIQFLNATELYHYEVTA